MRLGLLLGVLCCSLAACEEASEPIRPHSSSSTGLESDGDHGGVAGQENQLNQSQRPRIVAFGNSLTAGLGVLPEDSYPAELQRRLDAAGYRYRVINAGVSGDTTAGGLRRVDWVLNSGPHIVILELGGNDGLRGVDLVDTRSNLEQIIKRLQTAGVTIILAGMKLPTNYGPEYTERFAAMYPELARRYKVTLMPFFLEGVATQARLNQADGIHPTAEGYQVIVDHLMVILEPYLFKETQTRS